MRGEWAWGGERGKAKRPGDQENPTPRDGTAKMAVLHGVRGASGWEAQPGLGWRVQDKVEWYARY